MNQVENVPRAETGRLPVEGSSNPPKPDDPRVIKALEDYFAALEAGHKPDRQEFLACHQDIAPALAGCLDGLEFIRTAAPGAESPAAAELSSVTNLSEGIRPEGPLGDFHITREIGRGGMGVVYEAVQISLGRRVALKVLPFASTLDAKQLQRFKNEAQAAAGLHHTNIVPVYATGVERGVHFYAMQYIEGQPVAALIRELRQLTGLAGEEGEPAAKREGETPGKPQAGAIHEDPSAVGLASVLASGHWSPPKPAPTDSCLTGSYDPNSGDRSPVTTPHSPGSTQHAPAAAVSTERSTRNPAYFRTVANLGIQAALALEHAHGLGIIHRDVKPANLLVDTLGNLWVTDFGLALVQSNAGLTMTGDLLGTLRYMSPEQTLAKRVIVDHRTDIYSLGATLYELLALQPAYASSDRHELLRQVAFEEPRPPRKINKAIPAELETIILKAMEKNAADRYGTAQELGDDLRRFIEDRPIHARRTSSLQRLRKLVRRHKAVVGTATVAVAVALVLLLVLAVGVPLHALMRQERDTAVTNEKRAVSAEEKTRGVLHKLENAQEEIEFQYHVSQARFYRHSGQVGQRFKSLEELSLAARLHPSLEVRNEAIACLALPDSRLVKSLAGLGPVITLDPTFTHYAGSDSKGNISVRRVADGHLLKVLAAPPGARAHAYLLRFSPDGRFLATTHHKSYKSFVWNVDSGEIVLKPMEGIVLDFSPDSRQVAVHLPTGGIGLVDLHSRKKEQRFATGEGGCVCAFDPQGQRLAVASLGKPNCVRIYELPSGAAREIPMQLPARKPDLSWGPDGTLLAAARDGGVVCVVDTRDGAEQARLSSRGASLDRVAFDPTGDLLATTGWNDSALRVWDARTGKQLLSKMTNTSAPQFSRDGRLIACSAGKLELWEVTSGLAACRSVGLPSSRGGSGTVDFDPTGRILAMRVANGVSLWDCRVHREIAFLEGKMSVRALFDPSDGSLLVSGDNGLRRWPIRRTPVAGGEELVIGPPRLVIDPVVVHQISVPAGAGLLALSDYTDGQAIVLSWPGAAKEIARVSHRAVSNCALSPSGKWLAIGTWWGEGTGCKVYDAKTGNFAWKVPDETDNGDAKVAFSPDERWLVTCMNPSYRFWQVGSWAPGPVIPNEQGPYGLAFTRDGAIAAVNQKPNQVALIEVATGRELASLALGGTRVSVHLSFSADGTRLAVINDEFSAWIWDLRHIRQQLSAMGLDWDQPAYAPVGDEDDLPIIKVTILPDEAQEPMMALTTAGGRNIRAWTLVANSKVKTEDARAAVELAQKAVAEKPEIAAYWNTLGVAHYRAGAWQSAALALGKSLKLGGYEDCDLLFLAMVQCQQGDKQQARETFGRACQWMEQHKPRPEEVLRFREEAAVLLGLNEKSASGKK